jgi:hypothetical protein
VVDRVALGQGFLSGLQFSTTSEFHHYFILICEWKLVQLVDRIKGKGKAIPLQAWTGPKVSRRLRLPDLKTLDPWRL